MKRYIDADLLWNIRPQPQKNNDTGYIAGFYDCMAGFSVNIRKLIDNYAADVVPKSEVEELIRKQIDLHEECTGLKKAKQEVAREIFDEIGEECFDQFGFIDYDALAELEKKYTAN